MTSAGSAAIKRKPGRPADPPPVVVPIVQKRKKRRKLSAKARERIRQTQSKLWAAVKQSAKPGANAAAVAPSKPKKKAAKTAV